jgi:hypothetical protein
MERDRSNDTGMEPVPDGFQLAMVDIRGYRYAAIDPAGKLPPLGYTFTGPNHGWYRFGNFEVEVMKSHQPEDLKFWSSPPPPSPPPPQSPAR